MKIIKPVYYALLLACLASCGASTDKKMPETSIEQYSVVDESLSDSSKTIDLINTVYTRFVFATDSIEDMAPETYFTANALKKLQEDYEFDCDEGPCYAFYALRTSMQDSNPESDGTSQIYSIEPDGDSWYVVSYSDMGWTGKTRIKIVDNKIDDYQSIND